MISFSQSQQDIDVISFFNNKKDLYFVDISGYYANWFTNTALLEFNYNWKGISSQLFPIIFEKNKKFRNIDSYNYYVFSKSGLHLNFNKYHLLSHRYSRMEQKEYLEKNKDNTDNLIIVETITLLDFLDKYNAPKIIHYCSLDNEGSELELLKSFDFSKYKFLYITVEHNNTEPKKTEIKNLLLDNGYLLYNKRNNYIHESNIIGTYYCKEDYTKPIVIKRKDNIGFLVSSSYWDDETGVFNNGFITWKTLGKGKIFFTHIDYGDGNIWIKDKTV